MEPMTHPVAPGCRGEFCGVCLRSGHKVAASHKAAEEILDGDPNPVRHGLSEYLCCAHFTFLMGRSAGCGDMTTIQADQMFAGVEATALVFDQITLGIPAEYILEHHVDHGTRMLEVLLTSETPDGFTAPKESIDQLIRMGFAHVCFLFPDGSEQHDHEPRGEPGEPMQPCHDPVKAGMATRQVHRLTLENQKLRDHLQRLLARPVARVTNE